jgi:hypothetical protein
MEFYGSIDLVSGSVTASVLSGSFQGDGSGLYNVQASGVTGLNLSQIANGSNTASVSTDGFNIDTDTSITGSLKVSGTITAEQYNVTVVSSSVLYQSGSTKFGDSIDDRHDITGSVNITGSISLNGEAIGTGKLNETTFNSYVTASDSKLGNIETSTGSLNSFTSSIDTTIKSKLNSENVVSGSAQVNVTGTTGYSTFSSSINTSIGDVNSTLTNLSGSVATTTGNLSSTITNLSSSVATTDLSQNNRLDTIESRYATTGSNLFKGTQTMSGSIIPSVDNLYDLGSATHQWRDVYISSGSLYIDGTKVLSSTNQELTITTDTGQSLKILEGTTDSIIIQTADGDVELKSSGDGDILLDPTNGKIMLKGPVEVLSGQKIQSSVGGTPVVFANDIVVSGSIELTGTIDGIDLILLSSSLNTRVTSIESAATSLNSFTSSASGRLSSIETSTGSLNTFTSSINTTIKSKLDADGVISGSSQISLGMTNGYTTFSSSVATSVNDLSSSMNSLSSSFSSTDTSHNTRLTTIEGRYATTGSNIFKGNQTITGSLYISQNLIVQGSSSLENITASAVSIGTNKIILNSNTPAIRYAGISVFDSGSTNVTASLFYDSLTNNWKFQHSDVGTDDASILLYGPLGTGIDNAPTLVGNFLTKVEDNGHGHHLTTSSVFDNGSKISLKNNTEITGSLIVAGGNKLTVNAAGGDEGGEILLGKAITNTTLAGDGVTIDVWQNRLRFFEQGGNARGAYIDISSLANGVGTNLLGTAATASYIEYSNVANKPTLVSGSSQVLNGSGIWSGSAQLPSGVVSGSAQVSFSTISDKPTLVSGSSQIAFTGLSSIPGGLVSGSSQIDLTATTNYSSGILTRLNAVGVFSGSAQVSLTSTQVTNGLGFTPYNSTNPSGYITGINSSAVTTALGFTPYNSTNPSGYISGISFANVSSKPTTISGYGITDAITTGNIGSQTVSNSSQLQGLNKAQLWNNSGQNHSTYQTFGAIPNFGVWFMQNSSAADTPQSASQYYVRTQGLGNDYAYGTYGLMTAVARDHALKYTYYRTQENGTWGSWTKSAAGYADTAGALSSMNISQFTNNSGYITSYSETDTLGSVTNRGSSTSQNIVFSNGRKGLVGVYDAAQTQAIFAMGIDYVLANGGGSGTIGNHYGLAWSYNPDYGGSGNNPQSKAGLNHQLLHMQAGITTTAIGSGIWTSGGITCGTILPLSNNAHNLGSSGTRWANIFTNDLHLSNEGKEGGNEIDGTTGDWTIQEGQENLYIINHKNGKKYKIDLTEII